MAKRRSRPQLPQLFTTTGGRFSNDSWAAGELNSLAALGMEPTLLKLLREDDRANNITNDVVVDMVLPCLLPAVESMSFATNVRLAGSVPTGALRADISIDMGTAYRYIYEHYPVLFSNVTGFPSFPVMREIYRDSHMCSDRTKLVWKSATTRRLVPTDPIHKQSLVLRDKLATHFYDIITHYVEPTFISTTDYIPPNFDQVPYVTDALASHCYLLERSMDVRFTGVLTYFAAIKMLLGTSLNHLNNLYYYNKKIRQVKYADDFNQLKNLFDSMNYQANILHLALAKLARNPSPDNHKRAGRIAKELSQMYIGLCTLYDSFDDKFDVNTLDDSFNYKHAEIDSDGSLHLRPAQDDFFNLASVLEPLPEVAKFLYNETKRKMRQMYEGNYVGDGVTQLNDLIHKASSYTPVETNAA